MKCAYKKCKNEVPAQRVDRSCYCSPECAHADPDYKSLDTRSTSSGGLAASPQAAERLAFWASLKRTQQAVRGLALHYSIPIMPGDPEASYRAVVAYGDAIHDPAIKAHIFTSLEKAMRRDNAKSPLNALVSLERQARIFRRK
jgi:hypothetical protein